MVTVTFTVTRYGYGYVYPLRLQLRLLLRLRLRLQLRLRLLPRLLSRLRLPATVTVARYGSGSGYCYGCGYCYGYRYCLPLWLPLLLRLRYLFTTIRRRSWSTTAPPPLSVVRRSLGHFVFVFARELVDHRSRVITLSPQRYVTDYLVRTWYVLPVCSFAARAWFHSSTFWTLYFFVRCFVGSLSGGVWASIARVRGFCCH
ncbi:unnamed protein product [Laminaria digitata]